MQNDADAQETKPDRWSKTRVWPADQEVPFQAKVFPSTSIAMQNDADAHETDSRSVTSSM